jgi:hypothetical protein
VDISVGKFMTPEDKSYGKARIPISFKIGFELYSN